MGKKSTETEALFTPIKTTDDDDDDPELASNDDGGPATHRYRDDPQATEDDGGPPTSFRDDPTPSIFDWDIDKKDDDKLNTPKEDDDDGEGNDMYQIDDYDRDATGFSPVSLHDDSEEDDEENAVKPLTKQDRIRMKANKLINQRVFDDTTYDDTDDRIFVGGGWGRHGSQFSLCPNGIFGCCRKKKFSYGPPAASPVIKDKGYSTCQLVCLMGAFLAVVIGAGWVGYEAGLPVTMNEADDVNATDDTGEGHDEVSSGKIATFPHTRGEEWLHWIEHEREDFKMPHWFKNFSLHLKYSNHHGEDLFKMNKLQPKTQTELLRLSENIFQVCSERSLKQQSGRNACLSLCHGHYCCFEKDVNFGSCVAQTNSYCFAYAACENTITDFEMNNANAISNTPLKDGTPHDDKVLNAQEVQLLADTCSEDNIASLEGIRDCTAFCQHHMCCFNEMESENCGGDHVRECEAYGVCAILVDGPSGVSAGDELNTDPAAEALAVVSNPKSQLHTFEVDCVQSNLRTNWDICKSHCLRYECCFRSVNSCYTENAKECDKHYQCEEFYLPDDDVMAGPAVHIELGIPDGGASNQEPGLKKDSNPGSSTNVNPGIAGAVSAVCSLEAENPNDDAWVTACHALCADYLCCFSAEGTTSSCRDSMGAATCDAYQGCSVLHPASSSQETENKVETSASFEERKQAEIDAVNKSCTSNARRDPRTAALCNKACGVRQCCFQDGIGNCFNMNKSYCDEFAACEVLYP